MKTTILVALCVLFAAPAMASSNCDSILSDKECVGTYGCQWMGDQCVDGAYESLSDALERESRSVSVGVCGGDYTIQCFDTGGCCSASYPICCTVNGKSSCCTM